MFVPCCVEGILSKPRCRHSVDAGQSFYRRKIAVNYITGPNSVNSLQSS